MNNIFHGNLLLLEAESKIIPYSSINDVFICVLSLIIFRMDDFDSENLSIRSLVCHIFVMELLPEIVKFN
jgi:hypothetical protein